MEIFLTKQEIFDRVCAHLLAQGRPSLDGDACLYRGPDGHKCAVGCLIKDEFYSPDIEGLNVYQDSVIVALRCSIGQVSESARNLLSDLQAVHDDVDSSFWALTLKKVARKRKLKFKEPS